VHMPYHTTWSHENEAEIGSAANRMRTVDAPAGLSAAVASIANDADVHRD